MAPETTSLGQVGSKGSKSGRYSSRAPTHLPRQQDPLSPLSTQIPNRSHDLSSFSSSLTRQNQQEQSQEQFPRPPKRARSTRAERSCDTCRRRKLKCVRAADEARCVLCSFHQRPCTYLDEPQQRRKRRQKQKQKATGITGITTTPGISEFSETKPAPSTFPILSPTFSTFSTDLTLSLGLHPTTHFKYIGPGSLHEDLLLDFIEPSFRAHNDQDASKFCRVAEGVTFLARADATARSDNNNGGSDSDDTDTDTAAIARLVHPHGPALIDLYFRIVHPSYPILHKQIFLEQYRRASVVPAPLLAAVYLLALEWWEYDAAMGQGLREGHSFRISKPDGEALSRIATQSLGAAIQQPKLSTIQACLLLLQRGAATGHDSWVLTSQLVAVSEELGLHVDCSNWSIPAWEKGLRRRLAWSTFMQDKWSSLFYGRPSHVRAEHWRIPQLELDDFAEDGGQSENENDNNENDDDVLKGRMLFTHLARLTEVMAEALATFYSHDAQDYAIFSASDGMQTVALVKPVALRLRAWATALPSCLRMEAVRPRKLCPNGYLHLAYFVTEIMVYRCIVRSLARKPLPDVESATQTTQTTQTAAQTAGPPPPALVNLCREAAKTRLLHVMRFVEALRPEHLQAFWWFASAKSLAYIRTYVSMLWATSPNAAEAELYRQKLDEFRWSLRVRARGVGFVTAALRDMGESLEDIDMSSPPFERRVQAEAKKRELRSGARLSRADAELGRVNDSAVEIDPPAASAVSVVSSTSTPTDSLQNLGADMDHLGDFDEMVLQTTPEFLADFGVDASEAFFADINSLHLSMDGT